MLEPFKGEFFMHPAALDYSGNTCSNACAYCFASLRSEERRANIVKLSKLCLGKSGNASHTDWLFNQGYPVCISNRSDPFAASNRDNTGVVLDLMNLVPNGVFFQTKGLVDCYDYGMLDKFTKQNVVVYITISSMDDGISRRVEPGAPLPERRLELAEYARKRGWFVEIGVNPCVREWMPDKDFDRLVDRLDAIGVDNYFMQSLSLNKKDLECMNDARRRRLDEKSIADAVGDLCRDKGDHDYFVRQYFRLYAAGKSVHINDTPLPARLMDEEVKHLRKGINPVHSFINWAWDENERSGRNVFLFSDFIEIMFRGNPDMVGYVNGDLYKYIMVVNRALWKTSNKAKNARTFLDVYGLCWNSKQICNSPQNRFCFKVIVDREGRPVLDDFGNKILYFTGRDEEQRRVHGRTILADDIRGKEVR